ncbi:hypothetical protein BT96DRAFT_1009464 [Gymnopus androsaceus JB14]|uniref:F-box domain-containing protein n=1 Tax=Gymnopus androsaceus JB14 TaxID=1447944 RepID=A0A6A4GCU0_9AGAR|nr:hypothetical protein BT96DRAFT_1009464 [Gymnopus androsaceus JB14]
MVEPLPNELIDHVLENLYSDKATLKKCASVGKAWVRASQRGLFETIVLNGSYPSSTRGSVKTKLAWLIANEKPYLASYFRLLKVVDFYPNHPSSKEAAPWAAQVIQRLTEVNHILLEHCDEDIVPEFPLLREALYNIFDFPSVTRVTIRSCNYRKFVDLASLLSHAINLKALTVDNVRCLSTTSDFIPNLPPRSIKLDQFAASTGIEYLTPWFQQES